MEDIGTSQLEKWTLQSLPEEWPLSTSHPKLTNKITHTRAHKHAKQTKITDELITLKHTDIKINSSFRAKAKLDCKINSVTIKKNHQECVLQDAAKDHLWLRSFLLEVESADCIYANNTFRDLKLFAWRRPQTIGPAVRIRSVEINTTKHFLFWT